MNPLVDIMEQLDVPRARAAWSELFPHLPGPKSDSEAEAVLHMARTASISVAFQARAYSHAWCRDRGLPSQLPDNLKPRAERLYPTPVYAVGIATRNQGGAAKIIRESMVYAVLEAEGDGKLLDAVHVKRRIMQARAKELKKLFG